MPLNIQSKDNFSNNVRSLMKKMGMTPIEALAEYCEANEVDAEVAAKLIDASLFLEIQEEAKHLNLIEKSNSLPFSV